MHRIALIHALKHSPQPIEEAFSRIWPGQRLMNLLDDSLSSDLAREGKISIEMTERFLYLGRYAKSIGAEAVLFTCSAFGSCIEEVKKELYPLPVLKPNEAMIEEVIRSGHKKVGLVATFSGTLSSMPQEFLEDIEVLPCYVEGALEALNVGDYAVHDRLVADAVAMHLSSCDVVVLSQFSLARSKSAVEALTRKKVITTPDSAVEKIRALLSKSYE